MGIIEGAVQTINGSGYAFGSVDGLASVQEASANLKQSPDDPGKQAAYNAAYWNAVAAETAIVPGVGAFYASKAVSADFQNMAVNGFNPYSESGVSNYISLMGNLAILASQGVALGTIMAGAELTVPIAGAVFIADDLVNFASAVLTGAGVYLDQNTIKNYLAQGASAVGINSNADGTYNISSIGNSSLNITSSNNTLQSTFTMPTLDVQGGNSVYVPTLDGNGNITGFTSQIPYDVEAYGSGTSGASFLNGHVNTNTTGVPDAPTGASAVGVWDLNVPNSTGTATLVQYSDGSFGTLAGSPGQYTVTMQNVGAPQPGESNQVSMTDDNGQTSASVSGTGAALDLSSGTISLESGASATLNGTNDTLQNAGGSDVLSIGNVGNGLAVSATGTSLTAANSQTSVSISGSNDSASVTGTGNLVGITGNNDNSVVSGTGNTAVTFGSFDTTNAVGNSDNVKSLSSGDTTIASGNSDVSFSQGLGDNTQSLGQRQRLAIARALLTNPRILIFDEATSALDFETERIIQNNMRDICAGRTVMIIAHRLTAVRHANQIIAMDKGRIVEQGVHDALLAQGGYYAHLVSLQNS